MPFFVPLLDLGTAFAITASEAQRQMATTLVAQPPRVANGTTLPYKTATFAGDKR